MGKGNPKPKLLSSRGIPAQESLWLDGLENREKTWKYNTGEDVKIYQIIQLVFPKKYQPTLYSISLEFMERLFEKQTMYGIDIQQMLDEKSISKATFYNRVLPRLKMVGMIKTEKVNGSIKKTYSINSEFSNFFEIICMGYRKIMLKSTSGRYKKNRY